MEIIKLEKAETDLVCDNEQCSYVYEIPSDKDMSLYVDQPCPQCGENLLTIEDYLRHKSFIKNVKWINKWFGWIGYFLPKDSYETAEVGFHKKLSIEIKDEKRKEMEQA